MLDLKIIKNIEDIPEELLEKVFLKKEQTLYLLYFEQKLAGFGQIIKHNDQEYELASIEILEKFQSRGFGKKLIKFMIYSSLAKKLFLTTIIPDFYLKIGFKRTDFKPSFVDYNSPECKQCNIEKCNVLYFEKPDFLVKFNTEQKIMKQYRELVLNSNTMFCEFSLVNNIIWDCADNLYFLVVEKEFILVAYPLENETYAVIPPNISLKNIAFFIEKLALLKIKKIKCLSMVSLKNNKFLSNQAKLKLDTENSDYLYKTKDFASFYGNKFAKKRNRLKKFIKNYANYKIIGYQKKDSEKVLSFASLLISEKLKIPQIHSFCILKKALELNLLDGFFVEVAGEIAGLVFYSELNKETVVVHFELINPQFDGIGQLINNQLGKILLGKYKFINREQDLGLAGLRQSKKSYNPYRLIKKYEYLL